MKKYIFLFLVIIGCHNEKKIDMRILKNTKEFTELQKKVKIKFPEAEAKFNDYHSKKEYAELEPVFYYCEGEYYYFGYKTNPHNDKQNRSLFFYELKINCNTGEIKATEGQANPK